MVSLSWVGEMLCEGNMLILFVNSACVPLYGTVMLQNIMRKSRAATVPDHAIFI